MSFILGVSFGLPNQTFLSFFKTIQYICCGSKAPDHNFILSYLYLTVLKKRGLMTNSNTDFINVESL